MKGATRDMSTLSSVLYPDQCSTCPTLNFSTGEYLYLAGVELLGNGSVYLLVCGDIAYAHVNVFCCVISCLDAAFFSVILGLGGVVVDGEAVESHGFFQGYTPLVWTVVVLQVREFLGCDVIMPAAFGGEYITGRMCFTEF